MTGRRMSFQDLVVDAFSSACERVLRGPRHGTNADTRPILWLLLDHVLLLAQSPVHVSVSLVDVTGRIHRRFSSLSLQDRAFFGIPADPTDAIDGVVARRKCTDGTEIIISLREILGSGELSLPGFDRRSLGAGAQRLLDVTGERALSALQRLEWDHPGAETTRETPVVSEDLWRTQTEFLRRRLDPILTSYGRCDLFPRDTNGLTRLFVAPRQPFTDRFWRGVTAVRVVRPERREKAANYGYTARVFLTPTQRDERGLTQQEMDALVPLGQGARAIADTPLTSGIIDIGLPGEREPQRSNSREHYPHTTTGLKELEDKIYGPDWRSESIFYVPVHIGGLPWLALFSFHKGRRTDLMWRRYSIYRDLVPTIAEELSQAVAQAFADALAEAAREHLAAVVDPELFAKRVSAAWKALSVIFPYGEARLVAAAPAGGRCGPVRLHLPGRTLTFFLVVTTESVNVSYRLLDQELTRGLLELRLQAAVETRRQERHTLMGLAVHEWVNKLADGISRSERLKEEAIKAELDDALMDHVYGLYGTLHGDIGLPWILDETDFRDRGHTRHFTSRAAGIGDVLYLRHLFEFHVRAMLSAHSDSGPVIEYTFRCGTFPETDRTINIRPTDKGLAEVGRMIEGLLVELRSPWPLDASAGLNLTTREGITSAITLGPREILRNALRHRSSREVHDTVRFLVELVFVEDRGEIAVTARNRAPLGADVGKRLADIRDRCTQIENAVPFARCVATYDAAEHDFVVRCNVIIERGDHE